MNKLKFLAIVALFCGMSYAGYVAYGRVSASDAEKFLASNVEALTNNEGGGNEDGWVYCRCHDDGHCYIGNRVSFRVACIRLMGSTDCDRYRKNCPSYKE